MDIYEVTVRLHEVAEKIDNLAKSVKVLDDMARHAENADTYNRCVMIRYRLSSNAQPLANEFHMLENEYKRLMEEG